MYRLYVQDFEVLVTFVYSIFHFVWEVEFTSCSTFLEIKYQVHTSFRVYIESIQILVLVHVIRLDSIKMFVKF